MRKWDALWKWIQENGTDTFQLTFDAVEKIAGIPMDHSFLTYKQELMTYGFRVEKIYMKEKAVLFRKCP